jgi:parvulin-like peptidyl-prolyl isomerase
MAFRARMLMISLVILTPLVSAAAQAPPTTPPPTNPPADVKKLEIPRPAANAVAASVNGQEIPEMAVYRAFMHNPANFNAKNRKELINHLVDNMLVDQYLSQLKIQVDPKEIEARFAQIEAEAQKAKSTLKEMLGKMFLTEDDLRKELANTLRWEKFLTQQASDQALKDMFTKNPTMFDGTRVGARHILIEDKGPESQTHIKALRKYIEDYVNGELAKLPATTDALTREKERTSLLTKTFAMVAEKQSTCPSKAKGGELGTFARVGDMVEPFSKVAFALKPYEMSEPVLTEFGYHLIMCTEIIRGRETKFEDVKGFVQDVYGDRLREAVIAAYKPRSKIVINEMK